MISPGREVAQDWIDGAAEIACAVGMLDLSRKRKVTFPGRERPQGKIEMFGYIEVFGIDTKLGKVLSTKLGKVLGEEE